MRRVVPVTGTFSGTDHRAVSTAFAVADLCKRELAKFLQM